MYQYNYGEKHTVYPKIYVFYILYTYMYKDVYLQQKLNNLNMLKKKYMKYNIILIGNLILYHGNINGCTF